MPDQRKRHRPKRDSTVKGAVKSALTSPESLATNPIRRLLEEFVAVGTPMHVALVGRSPLLASFRRGTAAAAIAESLGLRSLDYARKAYLSKDYNDPAINASSPRRFAYLDAYLHAKNYVLGMFAKLRTDGRGEPSAGEFTSAVVLERLPASFFAVHMMYNLGHKFEGHAVSRLILEQLAWALAAAKIDDIEKIKKLSATRSVSELKSFVPFAGPLYGMLSKATHIEYESHLQFLHVHDGRNAVLHAHPDLGEYARVVLMLADLFGIVWEFSQRRFLDEIECLDLTHTTVRVRRDRPFSNDYDRLVQAVDEAPLTAPGSPEGIGED